LETNKKDPKVILTLTSLLAFFMYPLIFSVPPLLNQIMLELHLNNAQAGLVYSSPLIAFVAFVNVGGFISDKMGPVRVAGIGTSIMGVGSLLRGTSTDFSTLLMFSLLTGVGFGLAVPNLPKLTAAIFSQKLIGVATGVYTACLTIAEGIAVALTLPIAISLFNSWRNAVYFWSAMELFATMLWWLILGSSRFIVRKDQLIQKPQFQVNSGKVNPFWKNRGIWFLGIMFSIDNLLYYALIGWLPTMFFERGMSELIAALVTSSMIFFSIPALFLAPFFSDKIGLRKPFLWLSFLIMAVSCLSFLIVPLNLSWISSAIFGISSSIPFVLGFVLPIELVESENIGKASGIVLSIAYLGAILGPWFTGYIKDITTEFTYAVVIISVISIIAACFALAMPETGWKRRNRTI